MKNRAMTPSEKIASRCPACKGKGVIQKASISGQLTKVTCVSCRGTGTAAGPYLTKKAK